NIVGGIIIGVAQKGMSFGDATHTFTLLTVGDGLVSQMPALIVSTAAGVMGIVAVLPGMPTLVFGALSLGTGALAFYAFKRKDARTALAAAETAGATAAPKEEPISSALALDLLRIELGYGLLPLINDAKGHRVTDQIKALRRQLASEMGFVMPAVRILDNMQLPANAYAIRVKEVEAGRGELYPGQLLVMDPKGQAVDLPGKQT